MGKWIILLPLLLWVGYLIAANIYLNVNGLELTLGIAQDDVEVEVGSAFTWWPGRVRGRDLRVIVHDSHVELDLEIDHFDTDILLRSLVERRFETRTTTVTGARIRARKTRRLAELCRHAPGLPPVGIQALPKALARGDCAEQVDTARRRTGPPSGPEKKFRVQLGGIVISGLREVWIETFRVNGEVALSGRLFFWPSARLGFAARSLALKGGELHRGERLVIDGATLLASGELKEIALKDATAEAMWRSISFAVKTDVREIELELLQRIAGGMPPIAHPKSPALEGRALVRARAIIEAGVARSVSLDVSAMQAGLRLSGRQLVGRVKAELKLEPARRETNALRIREGRVRVTRLELRGDGENKQFGDASLVVTARGESLLTPAAQRVRLLLDARASRSEVLLELMPGDGFKKWIVDLVVDDDAPAIASAELVAAKDEAELEELVLDAGSLHVEGRMQLAPKSGGKVKIRYKGISMEKEL